MRINLPTTKHAFPGDLCRNFRRKDPFVVCSFYFCVVNVDVTTDDSDFQVEFCIVEECLFKVSL